MEVHGVYAVVTIDGVCYARKQGGFRWIRIPVVMAARLVSTNEAIEFPSKEIADVAFGN